MTKVCYIAKDLNHLTMDPKKAFAGRVMQGERDLMKLGRKDLEEIKEAAHHKFSYSQALYENILRDIQAGESGGSYLLDGTKLTSADGGYTVGGTESSKYRIPELYLDEDEVNDPEDIAAAVELYSDELEKLGRDGEAVVGFWVDGGQVCFDVSTWVQDIEEAKELAFEQRNEKAFFDLANMREVFAMKHLFISSKGMDAYVRYKISSTKYRNASAEDRMKHRQQRYLTATYKGFV